MTTKAKHEEAVEVAEEAPKAAAKKKPERWELTDELESLKAQGNPDPARLAEIKKQLAEG